MSQKVLKCSSCGAVIDRYQKFCTKCGVRLVATESTLPDTKKLCRKCNKVNEASATYCENCGEDIRDLLME